MDTCLIQTPRYYRQFPLPLGKESPFIFSKFNPLNMDAFYTPLSVHINGVGLYSQQSSEVWMEGDGWQCLVHNFQYMAVMCSLTCHVIQTPHCTHTSLWMFLFKSCTLDQENLSRSPVIGWDTLRNICGRDGNWQISFGIKEKGVMEVNALPFWLSFSFQHCINIIILLK